MIIRTRVYELATGKYLSLADLAKAMGLSVGQVYRVREGKRSINEKFIVGAKKAFPDRRLDELFYFHPGSPSETFTESSVVSSYNRGMP
jgi:transcriptional regulator with XRE-family HTH domain